MKITNIKRKQKNPYKMLKKNLIALIGTIYLEIRQWNGLHEVEAKSNAKKVLQNPDPPITT